MQVIVFSVKFKIFIDLTKNSANKLHSYKHIMDINLIKMELHFVGVFLLEKIKGLNCKHP
ncbi:hypothetical protein AFK71_03665 [Virgibacillus pantothenticus]|uniref:Uncharacterized protein n=1 Tax=Virgibacillus pantothenticus TaxID=1473 RepID=A0A0L0QTJ7_VIRPA|nr:hypothetical protein AFK71_03665 [Virgibacillus pantothenticus]